MRRLKSTQELEDSKRLKRTLIGGFLILVMLLSTAGFALNGLGSGSSQNPNGEANTVYNGQYWTYTLGGQTYYFTNKLEDLKNKDFNTKKTLTDFAGKTLYIDSDNAAAINEININLGRYAYRTQEACIEECEEDLPEKTCQENNEETIIIFKTSEEQEIKEEQNCAFITGTLETLDYYLAKTLGISTE